MPNACLTVNEVRQRIAIQQCEAFDKGSDMEKIVTDTMKSSLTSFAGTKTLATLAHPSDTLSVFTFDKMDVRVILKDGEPWFVAQDVCEAVALDDTSKAVNRLDSDEKGTNSIRTLGGDQEMLTINESGLYSLILTSRKPEAKVFKKWVTSEVLPSIRKTGSYTVVQMQPLVALPHDYITALEHLLESKKAEQLAISQRDEAIRTKAQIGSTREATAMATAATAKKESEALKARLGESVKSATVKAVEGLTKLKFKWKPLKDWCDKNAATIGKVIDEQYGSVNSYPAEAWQAVHDIHLKTLFSKAIA